MSIAKKMLSVLVCVAILAAMVACGDSSPAPSAPAGGAAAKPTMSPTATVKPTMSPAAPAQPAVPAASPVAPAATPAAPAAPAN